MDLDDVHAAARELAAAEHAVTRARHHRDHTIRAAYQHGWSIRAIAESTGLTPARISAILGHPNKTPGRPTKTPPPET